MEVSKRRRRAARAGSRVCARASLKDEEAEEARARGRARASLRRSEAEAMRLAAEVRKGGGARRRRRAAARARVKGLTPEKTEPRRRRTRRRATRPPTEPRVSRVKRASREHAGERLSRRPLPRRRYRWASPPPASLASGFSQANANAFPAAPGVRGDGGRRARRRAPSWGSRRGVRGSRGGRYVVVRRRQRSRRSAAGRPERPRRGRATAASAAAAAADLVVAAAEELKQRRSDEQSTDADAFDARVGVMKIPVARVVPARRRARRCSRRRRRRARTPPPPRHRASVRPPTRRQRTSRPPAPSRSLACPPRVRTTSEPRAHPGARGEFELETRVFAPASALWGLSPEGPEGPNVGASGEVRNGRADFSIGDDRPFGDDRTFGTLFGTTRSSTRDDGTGTFSTPSPFLSSVLVILSSSLSAGDWFAARAALRLLSRSAAEADPLRARGVFAVAAAAGHLERALGGEGARRGPGSFEAARAHPPRRCGRRTRRTRRRRLRAAPATPIGRAVRTENKCTDYIRARSRPRGPRTRNGTFRYRVRPRACAATRSRSCSSSRRPPSSRRRSPAPPRRDSPPSETRFRG